MAGGVTSLAILPDTDPAPRRARPVEMLTYRAKKLNRAHIYPVGALTIGLQGERLSEMAELVEAGCVAFSQANVPLVDNTVLMRAAIRRHLRLPASGCSAGALPVAGGHAHDGEVVDAVRPVGIPVAAETVAFHTYPSCTHHRAGSPAISTICPSSAAGLALHRPKARRRHGRELRRVDQP